MREHGMAERATFTSYSEEIRYDNNRRKEKKWEGRQDVGRKEGRKVVVRAQVGCAGRG